MSKQRNSSFELLRILAMYIIVLSHLTVHTGWPATVPSHNAVLAFLANGEVGVDVFMLISGYFLVMSKWHLRSFLRTLGHMMFYAVTIGLVFWMFVQPESVGLPRLLSSLLPISLSGGLVWFGVVYLVAYLLSPYLFALARELSQEAYARLLNLGFVVFCVVPVLMGQRWAFGEVSLFCYLLLLAGYYRLYGEWPLGRLGRALGHPFALPITVACYVVAIIARALAVRGGYASAWGIIDPLANVRSDESPLVLLMAMELMSLFAGAKPWHSRVVNGLAGTTFGVYLIHENSFVRSWLWPHFLGLYGLPLVRFVAAVLCVPVGVFAACAAVDAARSLLFRVCAKLIPQSLRARYQALCAHVDQKVNDLGDALSGPKASR